MKVLLHELPNHTEQLEKSSLHEIPLCIEQLEKYNLCETVTHLVLLNSGLDSFGSLLFMHFCSILEN